MRCCRYLRGWWWGVVLLLAGCHLAPLPAPPGTSTVGRTTAPEETATGQPVARPYPYTTPLPPPLPTYLDGIYTRRVAFEGTPTPCRRCAPYRAEGGEWRLILERGIFRVSHSDTGFHGVGSFTVTGNRLSLFNDPNCHLETGLYTWERDGRSLRLTAVDDPCAYGLRVSNLTAGRWLLQEDSAGNLIDPCQPPNQEAAVTGHWPASPDCR
jgi:hypothetical protein